MIDYDDAYHDDTVHKKLEEIRNYHGLTVCRTCRNGDRKIYCVQSDSMLQTSYMEEITIKAFLYDVKHTVFDDSDKCRVSLGIQ